jgi:hypothetical protein
MDECRGTKLNLHVFLTSTPDGGDWLSSRCGRCTPEERASATPWLGGWVNPRAGLYAAAK